MNKKDYAKKWYYLGRDSVYGTYRDDDKELIQEEFEWEFKKEPNNEFDDYTGRCFDCKYCKFGCDSYYCKSEARYKDWEDRGGHDSIFAFNSLFSPEFAGACCSFFEQKREDDW